MEFSSEEQRRSLYAELGATEEGICEGTNCLMEWLEKQPHLPNVKDEEYLRNVLLVCKNRLEIAKQHLENVYVARATMPEIFSNRRDFWIQFKYLCDRGIMPIMLPKLTPDGYRAVIMKIAEHTAEDLPSATSILKGIVIVFDIGLKSDQHRGFDTIMDFSNISAVSAPHIISVLKGVGNLILKVYKTRGHKFYVVNLAPAFHWVFTFALSLLPKKISKRVLLWNKNLDSLVTEIPKNILPSEYGGDGKCIRDLQNITYEYYNTYFDWLRDEDDVKADLTKMPSKNNLNFGEIEFGIDGSFRNIEWD